MDFGVEEDSKVQCKLQEDVLLDYKDSSEFDRGANILDKDRLRKKIIILVFNLEINMKDPTFNATMQCLDKMYLRELFIFIG